MRYKLVTAIRREISGILRQVPGFAVVALVFAVVALSACSTKKNTAMSRNWQAFTTRYNVYFNGSEHYKETLKAMEQAYEDDYSRQVLMHPA